MPRTPLRAESSPRTSRTPRTPRTPRRARQGCIRLAEVKAIDDSQVALGSFDLATACRVYELRADTAEEACRWIQAIAPFVAGQQGDGSSSHGSSSTTAGSRMSSGASGAQGQSPSSGEPLLGGAGQPEEGGEEGGERPAYQHTVPWCVETVWVDGSPCDAPLDITADLGAMPAGGFGLNVLLSDGTKLALKDRHRLNGYVAQRVPSFSCRLF